MSPENKGEATWWFNLRVEVHTSCSYPLASMVPNPLYKGYIPFLGRGVCTSAGLLGSFVQGACKRGIAPARWFEQRNCVSFSQALLRGRIHAHGGLRGRWPRHCRLGRSGTRESGEIRPADSLRTSNSNMAVGQTYGNPKMGCPGKRKLGLQPAVPGGFILTHIIFGKSNRNKLTC